MYPASEILADYLETLEPVEGESYAWPIYVASMPDASDRCLCVYDTTPVIQGRIMTDGETVIKPGVQIGIRSSNYRDGWAKARWIADALDRIYDWQTDKDDDKRYTIHSASVRSGPIHIGQEPGTRRERFTVNAQLTLFIADIPPDAIYLEELTESWITLLTVNDLSRMLA